MAFLSQENGENIEARRQFRYYSRRVFIHPNEVESHEYRIRSAMQLSEQEPLQGALADYFFGCWYDMPYRGEHILNSVEERLHPQIQRAFTECINKQEYIHLISALATRWSVLVMPSMNVESHRLRTSSDDAKRIASDITKTLLDARYDEDWERVNQVETEFFAHCFACDDRMAFSIVWFRLGKENWQFDHRWTACRHRLEQMPQNRAT